MLWPLQLTPDEQLGQARRVFRRGDVAPSRLITEPGAAAIELDVCHIDLHFFYDLDIVLLNVEVVAEQISLRQAQALIYRLGRAYPAGWNPEGGALHSLESLEWLSADGRVLARSDIGRDGLDEPFVTIGLCLHRWAQTLLSKGCGVE